MRLVLLIPCMFLLGMCAGCGEPPQSAPPFAAKDFSLQAETVEALEGGPVVLRLTLTFQGDKPVEVIHPFHTAPDALTLSVPESWERREPFGIDGTSNGIWPMSGHIRLDQGYQCSTTIYVHEQYTGIPSGRVSLKARWWMGRDEGDPGLELTTTVDLNVPPATPENLEAVRRRIESDMEQPALSRQDKYGLARRILGTKHRALVPTALRMIDSGDRSYDMPLMIRFAYEGADAPEDLHTRFVNLVITQHEALARDLFWYWHAERVVLPDRELNKLMGADSIWVRAMTYSTFGRRCDATRVKTTLRGLSELQKPIAPEQFTRLLTDLDDDDFATREQASRSLERLGERVKGQLRSSLDTPLAVEARKRAGRLLEQLDDLHSPLFSRVHPGVPSLAADTLDYLRYQAPPEGQKVLEAIAQGHSDSPITKLAQTILDERAKRAVNP